MRRARVFCPIASFRALSANHGPSRSTNRQPRVLDEVAAPFRAPRSAGDRFHLVGRYDEDDHTLHLFYSDGLFSVSVFEQKGELDPTGLPAGAEVIRCADAAGNVSYTDGSCPRGAHKVASVTTTDPISIVGGDRQHGQRTLLSHGDVAAQWQSGGGGGIRWQRLLE